MKRYLPLLFLIILFYQVNLFAQSTEKMLERSIKFIDLSEEVNAPFWGRNREISRLIMTALSKGSIKAYYLDYAHDANVTELTKDEYDQHTLFFYGEYFNSNVESAYNYHLFASDFPYLSLDQTRTIVDGRECVHVHYVNFYCGKIDSNYSSIEPYRFSVTWEDFIRIIEQRSDLLYTLNTYGAWWRGNMFITNEKYFIESKTSDFIELSKANNVFAKDFYRQHTINTVDALNEKIYESTLMDLYILEKKSSSSTWNIKQIAFGTIPEQMSYVNEKRFLYKWQDFVHVVDRNRNDSLKDIYTLSDAFLLKKFQYSDEIKTIQISVDGMFENGNIDPICLTGLKESFSTNEVHVSYTKYQTQLLESIYLGDSLNKLLNIPGHSIAEILYEYLLNGKLKTYPNDSLNIPMSEVEFKYYASQILDAPDFFYDDVYKKGDTVIVNNWPLRKEYYILQQDFNSSNFSNDSSLYEKVFIRYYPPLMPITALNVIELYQHVTFDSNGDNKKYTLQCLALHVAADAPSNIRGIQYPICFVRWDDLKALLLKDRRAYFKYQGRKINLVDLIENREFLSTFFKTGYVEIGE